jgi:hypothetical protein
MNECCADKAAKLEIALITIFIQMEGEGARAGKWDSSVNWSFSEKLNI